eukprot:scaffold12884_cov111-Isochrysis_galbana.AAC.2
MLGTWRVWLRPRPPPVAPLAAPLPPAPRTGGPPSEIGRLGCTATAPLTPPVPRSPPSRALTTRASAALSAPYTHSNGTFGSRASSTEKRIGQMATTVDARRAASRDASCSAWPPPEVENQGRRGDGDQPSRGDTQRWGDVDACEAPSRPQEAGNKEDGNLEGPCALSSRDAAMGTAAPFGEVSPQRAS